MIKFEKQGLTVQEFLGELGLKTMPEHEVSEWWISALQQMNRQDIKTIHATFTDLGEIVDRSPLLKWMKERVAAIQ